MSEEYLRRQLRLQRLRVAVKLMVFIALAAILWVMVSSSTSRAPATRVLPELQVAIGDLPAGQVRRIVWAERPIIIVHRSRLQIDALNVAESGVDKRLRDPESSTSVQPDFAGNSYRSYRPEWFIAVALGTDLNCSIDLLPASDNQILGETWQGGFKDSCRGSYYDLAGRVYEDQYADRNLEIPQYTISGDMLYLGRTTDQ